MTMLILDGFDHYGQGAVGLASMLDGAWAEVGAGGVTIDVPSWGPARSGQYAFGSRFVNQIGCRRVLPSTHTAELVGMGFAVDALPTKNAFRGIVDFRDGSNAVIASLICESTGVISLYIGATAHSTQTPVIVPQNWHFLEMKLDTVAGTFELHVDDSSGQGVPVLALTGLSLGSVAIAQNAFVVIGNDVIVPPFGWVDDINIRSTAGTVNNDFQGDLRVATSFANGDDATNHGWTPNFRHNIGTGILDARVANAVVLAASSSATDMGNGDFTLEGFFRFASLPTGANKAVFWGKWDETNNRRSYQLYLGGPSLDSGMLTFRTSTNGQAGTVVNKLQFPVTFELDTWYNVCLVRTSGELLLFVDGAQQGLPQVDTDTYYVGTETTCLGAQVDNTVVTGTSFAGFIDEMRMTVGVARYSGSYTPTTVPYDRSSSDPDWNDVVWLSGFDSGIFDESQFARTLNSATGVVAITPDDGPDIGTFSAINHPTPQDDTFIEAPLLPAMGVFTLAAQVANADSSTVGTTDGSAPAVYTFVTALASAYDVLIGVDDVDTLTNLLNAINQGPGSGVKYGAGTVANFDVSATSLPGAQMAVSASLPGAGGNSIATTASLTNGGGWGGTTLSGGASIPGPSDFTMQRPPALTTVIAAVQITFRGYKSDAGTSSVKSSFVGPLGGHTDGSVHALTVSPTYYADIFETDPDTTDAITPTTLVGGRLRLTRTA